MRRSRWGERLKGGVSGGRGTAGSLLSGELGCCKGSGVEQSSREVRGRRKGEHHLFDASDRQRLDVQTAVIDGLPLMHAKRPVPLSLLTS